MGRPIAARVCGRQKEGGRLKDRVKGKAAFPPSVQLAVPWGTLRPP